MIQPVLALIAWTLVMLVWVYARRIPALFALKIMPQRLNDKRLLDQLPAGARAVSDNYSNLLEQPVLFYVLCLGLHLNGWVDQVFIIFAWIYVGLRIVHSLIHAVHNVVVMRFCVFICASGVLSYMVFRAIRLAFDI